MKAAVLHDVMDLRIEDVKKPVATNGYVLVNVHYCGVCGSDLPRYLRTGSYDMPKILGHEFMGAVSELGNGVTNIRVGERVSVNPLIPCGGCKACRQGLHFHCENYTFLGSRINGGWAEYVVVPEQNLIKLPDSVSDPSGAMLEPVSVAHHCVKRLRIQSGHRVVVIGAGAIGIFIAQWAQYHGADVAIVDIRERSLEIARQCGLSQTLDASRWETVTRFADGLNGMNADVVVEAAGSRISTIGSLYTVANRGKVGLVGRISGSLELAQQQMELIQRKEISVEGLWGFDCDPDGDNDWISAAEGLSEKIIVTDPLVTHVYSISDAQKAVDMMIRGDEYFCKVLLEVGQP